MKEIEFKEGKSLSKVNFSKSELLISNRGVDLNLLFWKKIEIDFLFDSDSERLIYLSKLYILAISQLLPTHNFINISLF